MFQLINELAEDLELATYLVEAVKEIFPEEVDELYEGAQHYLGKAMNMLKSGENPFQSGEVDPHVVASLVLLADPENREAFNISPNKFAVVDHVDKNERVQSFLKQKVGSSASGRAMAERLSSMATENPQGAVDMIKKAHMLYTKASGIQQAA